MSTTEETTAPARVPTVPPAPNRFKDLVLRLIGTRSSSRNQTQAL
jgi:peptide/nickel transport system permease protein